VLRDKSVSQSGAQLCGYEATGGRRRLVSAPVDGVLKFETKIAGCGPRPVTRKKLSEIHYSRPLAGVAAAAEPRTGRHGWGPGGRRVGDADENETPERNE